MQVRSPGSRPMILERRPVTAVVVDTHDEWQVAERRYLSEESMALLHALDTVTTPELSPA